MSGNAGDGDDGSKGRGDGGDRHFAGGGVVSHGDMAEALFEYLGERVRFVPDLRGGEFVLFNKRWHDGSHAWVVGLIRRFIETCAKDMKLKPRAWKETTSGGFLNGTLAMLKTYYELHRALEEWDTEPAVLQTPEGVWNLETRRVSPMHGVNPISAVGLNLHCTAVPADPTKPCPKFMALLDNAFSPSPEDRRFFEDRIGSALFGNNGEQKFNWLVGNPNSGKSTLMQVIVRVLGSYARIGKASLIVLAPRSEGPSMQAEGFHLASLARARLVVFDEARANGVLNAPLFKGLADGRTMMVEEKRQQPRQADIRVSPFLITNKLIQGGLGGEDGASLRRRIALILADGTPPPVLNPNLITEIMAEEAEGVLWWLIQHAVSHFEARGPFGSGGVPEMSDIARDTVEGFTKEGTPELDWMVERLELTGNHADMLLSRDMWEDFETWIGQARGHASGTLSETNFHRLIAVAVAQKGLRGGLIPVDPNNPSGKRLRGYRGLVLKQG
jgi:putative DNA primase/helicase